jgi:hypothetical protein
LSCLPRFSLRRCISYYEIASGWGFPDFETKLVTEKGTHLSKQDIFKGLMWFAYTNTLLIGMY